MKNRRGIYLGCLTGHYALCSANTGGTRGGGIAPVITSEAASTRVFEYSNEYRVLDTQYRNSQP